MNIEMNMQIVYLPYFPFHVPLIRDASPGVGDQPLCASQGLQGFPLGSTRKLGEDDETLTSIFFEMGFFNHATSGPASVTFWPK